MIGASIMLAVLHAMVSDWATTGLVFWDLVLILKPFLRKGSPFMAVMAALCIGYLCHEHLPITGEKTSVTHLSKF